MGRGDANFQGINPQLLEQLTASLAGGVSHAQPLAGTYLAQFGRLGLDTGGVRRLQSDYAWAASQQAMLSRRHSLACHQPPGSFSDGLTSAGAGVLTFTSTTAAAKSGSAAAEKLAAALAAGDDSAAQQQLAVLAEHDSDSDYMTAFSNWAGQHDPSLLLLGQPGFAAYYTSLQAWFRSTGNLWASPAKLHDHAWGGPGRPNGPPHAPDFGAVSQQEYAKLAYQFLADAKGNGYQVKVGGGTVRVYDQATNTFGSFASDGTVKTFFKPKDGAAYWAKTSNGVPATGTELDTAANSAATRIDETSSWFSRAGRLMDTPAGRAGGKVLGVLGAASDVYTIAQPSSGALGGAGTERGMAIANLGAMGLTAGPAAALLAANSLDWVPVAGEVVMAATAAYFVGDLVYENRRAVGHALSWAGHETVQVADDVGHDISSGASHAWHSLFG